MIKREVRSDSEMSVRWVALRRKFVEVSGGSDSVRDNLNLEPGGDSMEHQVAGFNRDLAVQQLEARARLIHDLQRALEGIQAGTYGICSECEESIGARRLDAVPWARLCITCQGLAESAAREAA